MEWRGRGRQEQARASGRLCCMLWHVGCVLPGSGRAVDRPTHQIGFRKLARQVPTNENQLSPVPVPVPVPVPQVPSPKPQHREPQPARTHPIQFTWAHCAAVSSLPPYPALALPLPLPPPLASASRLSIDLRYVTSRACQSSASHCHQTASPPIFSSPTFHSNKIGPDQHRHCSSTVTICFPPSIASPWRFVVHPCHQLASIFPSPPILNANNACIHVDSHRPPALFPPNAPRHHVAQPSSLCLTRAVRNLLLRLLQTSMLQLTTTLLTQR